MGVLDSFDTPSRQTPAPEFLRDSAEIQALRVRLCQAVDDTTQTDRYLQVLARMDQSLEVPELKAEFIKLVGEFMADDNHPVFKANKYRKFDALLKLFSDLNPASTYNTFGHKNLAKLALGFNPRGRKIYVLGQIPDFLRDFEVATVSSLNEVPNDSAVVFLDSDFIKPIHAKYQIWTTNPNLAADIQFRGDRAAYINPKNPDLHHLTALMNVPSGYPVEFLAANIVDSYTQDSVEPRSIIESDAEQDPEISNLLVSVFNLPQAQRLQAITTFINRLYGTSGIDAIIKFISQLKNINWYTIYKRAATKDTHQDLSRVLQLEFDIYEAIKWAIVDLGISDNWVDKVTKELPDIQTQNLAFTSAGLPENYPVVERFKRFCKQFIADADHPFLSNDQDAKKQLIQSNFNNLAAEVFPGYHIYSTYSTTNSLHLMIGATTKPYVYLEEGEYEPMIKGVLRPTNYAILNSFRPHSDEFAEDYHSNEDQIFVVSSLPRTGRLQGKTSYKDLNTAVSSKRITRRNIQIFVDASQDSRLIGSNLSETERPDVVMFGKRTGESGRGFVISVKPRPELDMSEDYPVEFLAANFASLYALHHHRAYTAEDLLKQPTIISESKRIDCRLRLSSTEQDPIRAVEKATLHGLEIENRYRVHNTAYKGSDFDSYRPRHGTINRAFNDGNILLVELNSRFDFEAVVGRLEQVGVVVDCIREAYCLRVRVPAFAHPQAFQEFKRRFSSILDDPRTLRK